MRRTVTAACVALLVVNWDVWEAYSRRYSRACADDANVLAEFSVAKRGGALLLPVHTMDREFRFLLDTGCTSNWYDTTLTHTLKKLGTLRTQTSSGIAVRDLYEAPMATLGPMSIDQGPGVLAHDFENVTEAIGSSLNGVIGMSHLRHYIVEINFDSGVVRFLKEKSLVAGEGIDLTYERGVPSINITLDELGPQLLCIDTGASSELRLEAGVFDLLRLEKKLKEFKTDRSIGVDLKGRQVKRKGQLSELKVGSFVHRNMIVHHSQISALGLGYLSRYLVTFDFPNNKLYLKPSLAFDRQSLSDATGIGIILRKNQILIEQVTKNSPAAEVGIEAGDVLLEVDGSDARKSSLFDLRNLFSHAGEKHRLKVQRGEEVRTREILLRELD